MIHDIASLPLNIHIALAGLLGLLVGSFLNVVITRLPQRLFHQWTEQSTQWLSQQSSSTETDSKALAVDIEHQAPVPSILFSSSHCPTCKATIKPWHNIPLVSFLLLKARCASCNMSISWRYPTIELLCGALSALVLSHFGWSLQSVFALILTWTLITLTFIDFDHQLLPDSIVLPLCWLGLAINLATIFKPIEDAVIGAIAGYLCLWIVFQLFKLLTGKEGMGYGDFKLLALLGAWLGWQALPLIIIISSLLGAIVGIGLIATGKSNRQTAIAFGPYIAIAGWIALIWGDTINRLYLLSIGF